MRFLRCLSAGALALIPLIPACTCGAPAPAPGAAGSASATLSASAPAASSAEGRPQELDVRPVYPALQGPPHPLASRLCGVLHDIPKQRRAACCSQPPEQGIEAECLRNLSGALSSAAVTVEEEAIARCELALKESLQGCDWVAPLPFSPPLPGACQGLLKGTLKAGAVCRSSLECEGALSCAGVGPTATGRCVPPRESGPCGPRVDPLGTYTLQSTFERAHPQCTGFCDRRRCAPLVKEGEACTFHDACGSGHHCGDGKCKKGEEGKEGERCLGTRCAADLRCDRGTCVAPKKEGESCERNEQCRGFCNLGAGDGPEGGKGTCGARCARGGLPAIPASGGKTIRSLVAPVNSKPRGN